MTRQYNRVGTGFHVKPRLSLWSRTSTFRPQLQCRQTYDKVTPPIPSDWRDDPPQEVRAFSQYFLRNAQAADIIHCHLLTSFPNSLKRSIQRAFLPSCILPSKTLPITILHCKVGTTHCLVTPICIRTSFGLFQNLFDGRLLLPLSLLSFLFFLSAVRQIGSCSCPFASEILPHAAQKLFISHTFRSLLLHYPFPLP